MRSLEGEVHDMVTQSQFYYMSLDQFVKSYKKFEMITPQRSTVAQNIMHPWMKSIAKSNSKVKSLQSEVPKAVSTL